MKVLQLITDLDLGGAPLVVRDLALGLDKSRCHLAVASLSGVGTIGNQLQQAGIEVFALNARGRWDFSVLLRLKKLLQRFRPDILHCHLLHANTSGRLAGRWAGVPHIIATIHTAEREKRWHLLLEHRLASWSDLTVCVSDSVARFMQETAHLPAEKLAVIYHGIDFQKFASAPPLENFSKDSARPVVLFIGRLDPVKNIDVLIRAVASLRSSGFPGLNLWIVGAGPQLAHLQQLCHELHLTDNVRFWGPRLDVEKILPLATVLALPSKWEGLGLAALEALAAGVPVVASRTDGLIDIIKDEETGLLIPPGDPAFLAAALRRILENPGLAQKLSQSGQELIHRRFIRAAFLTNWQNLYDQLTSKS